MIRSAHLSSHCPIKFGNGLTANRKTAIAACAKNQASDRLQLEKMSIMPRILGHSPHQSSKGLNP